MVTAGGRGVEGGGWRYEGVKGGGRIVDDFGVVNTPHSVQVRCCKIVHLKPGQFC